MVRWILYDAPYEPNIRFNFQIIYKKRIIRSSMLLYVIQ